MEAGVSLVQGYHVETLGGTGVAAESGGGAGITAGSVHESLAEDWWCFGSVPSDW